MAILLTTLGGLAGLSIALALWQGWLALRFPLHQRRTVERDAERPGVTLLKPLKGCDEWTRSCLLSWWEQDYRGPVQTLFAVASLDDPVVPLVRELMAAHPAQVVTLIHCPHLTGANAKVSKLAQIAPLASHPIVCVSDADVWVPVDYLSQAVDALTRPGVGLVHSFYRYRAAAAFGMRWEAFAVNADFWSQVLQSASLAPVRFALGAAMLIRREALAQAGGFEPIVDALADDYQLGKRISKTGWGIHLLPIVVECRSSLHRFRDVWQHQVRWARTIRVCQPGPYFFSILGNATVWPLIWAAAARSGTVFAATAGCLAVRAGQAYFLERRLTQIGTSSSLWMSWIKDLLQLGIWVSAFTGNVVTWRGVTYTVEKSGKLTRMRQNPALEPLTEKPSIG